MIPQLQNLEGLDGSAKGSADAGRVLGGKAKAFFYLPIRSAQIPRNSKTLQRKA